jgi:hypothetical protein
MFLTRHDKKEKNFHPVMTTLIFRRRIRTHFDFQRFLIWRRRIQPSHSTDTLIITLFAFKLPPFSGTRINECTTQGKVNRKIIERKSRHTFFNSYDTTILKCLYGYTLYRLLVTIVDDGPAYEGKETKHKDKIIIMRNRKQIAQFSNPACWIELPPSGSLVSALGVS